VVTPVAAGNVTFTYTVSNGYSCSTAVTYAVTVNALPGAVSGNAMAAITGTTAICAPGAVATSTTQLTHSVSGGVWTTSDATKATVDSSSGLVTAVAAGTATITYTLTSGAGCTNTKTIAITVNPVLVPSVTIAASATTICNTTSVTFTATPTNGGTPTYQWQKNGSNVGTNAATYVDATLANGDVITCNMTSTATCYSVQVVTSNSITMTVNPLPIVDPISGASTICALNSVTLSNTTSGGVWSSVTPAIATVNSSGVVTGVTGGSATIRYTVTDSNGCITYVSTVVPVTGLVVVAPITGIATVEILAIGGGGGSGGNDGPNGAGGGGGGAVYGSYNLTNSSNIYSIGVGGGGGAGAGCSSNAAGGAAGANGGGTGGNAGAGGCSGGGGGGGGWSGFYQGTTYYVVAGGGAGGGGSNEGTANDVFSPGGGLQTNGANGTNMTGANGAAYSGDGGGGGAGGGGYYGGAGQTNLTGSGYASGGANYLNPTNKIAGTTYNGNNGAVGGAPGAAVTVSNASSFNYSNNYGVGGTGTGNPSGGGNAGIVIVRYPGAQVGTGGTVTSSGGYTLHTFTSSGTFTAGGGNAVCVGSTMQLYNNTTGGVWSSSDSSIATINSSTGLVSGISAGVVTISYTVTQNSCPVTVTKSVTVNPLPVVPAITGPTAVCVASTITLANTTTGGVWSSGNTALATVNSSTGVVTGVSAGTVTITYTVTSAYGCVTAVTYSVVVNPLPVVAAITGTLSVCAGSTTTLASTTSGGIWSSATTSVATVNSSSGVVTGVVAGTSVISYTVTDGTTGCIKVIAATVTVNPLPTITTTGTINTVCYSTNAQTTTLAYSATTNTPTSYSIDWDATANAAGLADQNNTSFAFVAGAGTITAIPITAGTAVGTYNGVMTITNGNGCTKTQAVSIIVYANPVIPAITGVTTVCVNSTTTLSDTYTSVTNVWSSSNTSIATVGASTGIVTGISAGTCTITYTVTGPGGCASSVSTVVTVNALPGISAPVVGNALNFDGVDDYVNCTNNAALQITTGTIEAWIKTSNAGSSYRGIVTKQSAYGLFLNSNTLIAYDWSIGADRSTGINLADNVWHHVALSFNNGVANGSFVYIDGVLKLTTTYTVPSQGVGLAIGAGYDTGSQFFTGNIDEVRVWNTNRTQAQIQATMNTELTGNEANLIAYYNINQGVAGGTNTGLTTLTNKTTYPVNGTLNNFALSGATSNYVTGNVSASGMAAITGTLSVCAPGAVAVNTTQLSHPVAGGVWTSSDPTKATINTSTGLVTGVAA
jgi:uncharacterized protein YjdB